MPNIFNTVQTTLQGYNAFSMSHSNKFTTDLGILTPSLVMELDPGDKLRINLTQLIRTQPLVAPIMSNFYSDTHLFFVPYRLVYEDWSKFIVRGDDGETTYIKPYINPDANNFGLAPEFCKPGSLLDYLNFPSIPKNVALTQLPSMRIEMMLPNAYNLIYNEYYRDENLQPEIPIFKKSGQNDNYSEIWAPALTDYSENWQSVVDLRSAAIYLNPFRLRTRAWKKDYFTSALPFVQKGPQVSLGQNFTDDLASRLLPVQFFGNPATSTDTKYMLGTHDTGVPSDITGLNQYLLQLYNVEISQWLPTVFGGAVDLSDFQHNLMTIADLRVGIALSQWYELNARVGSARYTEYLFGHFGVRDRDGRLQRPEYLGSFHTTINVSDVDQTSETNTTPLGTPAGKGLGFDSNGNVNFFVPEHGFIIAITSIMPHAVYFMGLPRMWTRFDSFDYYDKFFDHLSEQAVLKRELYFNWTSGQMDADEGTYGTANDSDFGYQVRFAELRTAMNELHGSFRGDLDYWVPRRTDIQSAASLNESFITVDGYSQHLYDTFAYPGTEQEPSHHFLCYFDWQIRKLSQKSKFGTPKTI